MSKQPCQTSSGGNSGSSNGSSSNEICIREAETSSLGPLEGPETGRPTNNREALNKDKQDIEDQDEDVEEDDESDRTTDNEQTS